MQTTLHKEPEWVFDGKQMRPIDATQYNTKTHTPEPQQNEDTTQDEYLNALVPILLLLGAFTSVVAYITDVIHHYT